MEGQNSMKQPPRRRGPMGHGPMGHGPAAPGEKAKDFKGTFKKLVAYLSRYHFAIVLAMIMTIGSTVFNIVGPKVLGKATTEIFNGLVDKLSGGSGIDFGKIGRILLILIGLYLLSMLLSYVQGFIMSGISQKMAFQMRKELSEKLNRLPMNYYDRKTYGEILSRITNDVDTLGMSLNQTITQVISAAATLVGILIMMLTISPLMTVIALLILPVSGMLIGFVVKRSQKYFTAQQEYLGHVNGQVEEVYGGHNVIKLFNKEEDVIEEFTKTNEVLYESAWKSQFMSGMMMPIMNFVGNMGYVAVAIIGAYLSIKGTIEVGDIQSFIDRKSVV